MELGAVDSSPNGSVDRLSYCFISVLFYFFRKVCFVDYDMRLMRVSDNWSKIKNLNERIQNFMELLGLNHLYKLRPFHLLTGLTPLMWECSP